MNTNALLRYSIKLLAPSDGGDGGGGSGGGDAVAQAAATASASAKGGAASGDTGAASSKGTAPATASSGRITDHLSEDGKFKTGWAKGLGLPDAWEQKFTTPDALLKSHVTLEKMLGSQNKVALPGKNATPEERAAFFKTLGMPEKPDGYNSKPPETINGKPFPKDLFSEADAKQFANFAHTLGLTAEQHRALIEFDAARGLRGVDEAKLGAEKSIKEAVDALKKDWGANYDANLALAERGAVACGFNGEENAALANNPAFIRAMQKVGAMVGESALPGKGGTAPIPAQQRIAEIQADKSHPYWNKAHKLHSTAVREMQGLFEQLHGKTVVSGG